MSDNPFKKKPESKSVSEDVNEIGLENVCPFLTSPSLLMVNSTVEQRVKGAPAVQPALGTSLSPCIEDTCAFWHKQEKCCVLISALTKLAGLSKAVE
jgi:hypothetical protein